MERGDQSHSPTHESHAGSAKGRTARQPRYSRRPRRAIDRSGRAEQGRGALFRCPEARRGRRPRPRRDRTELGPPGLQNPRLRQVPLQRAEEAGRGAQEAEDRRGQGDQAPAEHRQARLRREDEAGAAFFEEGDKVKVTLRFRGREMAHTELGVRLLEKVKAETATMAKVESEPQMEGRQMIMILA